jgi:hypothetical protein
VSDVALTWLSFAIWLVLTAVLFIVLARWSAGEGEWGGLPGIVRGFHDWATGARTSMRVSSSPTVRTEPPSPRAELEEL